MLPYILLITKAPIFINTLHIIHCAVSSYFYLMQFFAQSIRILYGYLRQQICCLTNNMLRKKIDQIELQIFTVSNGRCQYMKASELFNASYKSRSDVLLSNKIPAQVA